MRHRRLFKDPASGYRGVTKHSRGWRARITIDYALIHLGIFATPQDAADAYDKAAIERYGELAVTNTDRKVLVENQ